MDLESYQTLCKPFTGRTFNHGVVDCYSLIIDFYQHFFKIKLTNYSRPDDWWDEGLNLYNDYYLNEGFKLIHFSPHDMFFGDILVASVMADVANHGALWLGNNFILHHLPNRLSCVENLRGLVRSNIMMVLRHESITEPIQF